MNNLEAQLGFKGERGDSAYEIAVQNGYEGTEAEWADSFLNSDNYYNKSEVKGLVIDNLTSETTDQPLSAKQGKVLKGLVDEKADGSTTYSKTEVDGKFAIQKETLTITDATTLEKISGTAICRRQGNIVSWRFTFTIKEDKNGTFNGNSFDKSVPQWARPTENTYAECLFTGEGSTEGGYLLVGVAPNAFIMLYKNPSTTDELTFIRSLTYIVD